MSTPENLAARVAAHPRYPELLHRRRRTSLVFFVLTWIIYAGYILTLAFNPGLMSQPVGGMTMSYGVLAGVLVCISAVVLISWYVYLSNKVFDPLLNAIMKDVQ